MRVESADESLCRLAAFAFAFRSELLPLVAVQLFGIGLIAAGFGVACCSGVMVDLVVDLAGGAASGAAAGGC